MKTVYYLSLEPLEMRYTKMQDRVTQEAFKRANYKLEAIGGDTLSDSIKTGAFLDSNSTNYFKFSQLRNIAKMFSDGKIKDGSIFYVSDLWFPGLEAIKYMAFFQKIDIKIYGIFHAGSFTPTDFVNGMKNWAAFFERGWLRMVDGVFVGTEQVRQDLLRTFTLGFEELEKIHVTGLAYDSKEVEKYLSEKENIIVFPHRLHKEKQPELFDKLAQYVNAECIKTHEHNFSKKEYYELLGRSKVLYSASLQENFGYSVLEGCSLKVTPVLPFNNTDYKYIYPPAVLYKSFEESVDMVKRFLQYPIDLSHIPRQFDKSVDRQVEVIRNGKDFPCC